MKLPGLRHLLITAGVLFLIKWTIFFVTLFLTANALAAGAMFLLAKFIIIPIVIFVLSKIIKGKTTSKDKASQGLALTAEKAPATE